MEKDIILNGIHIGEHSFDPQAVIRELEERCIRHGHNFVTIRTSRAQTRIRPETFLTWAKYLADHKVYFVFLYTLQNAPAGCISQFDPETVAQMKQIAGAYFLGDMIGETGGSSASWYANYPIDSQTVFTDMQQAQDAYLQRVRKYRDIDMDHLGMPEFVSVEATVLNKYNVQAGVTVPMLECMCGDPDILVSALRGTARAFDSKLWGTYIAHEWYGGMRHSDPLKRKRLRLAYQYCYLSGTNALCLESGDECIDSYGCRLEASAPECMDYTDTVQAMTKLIREDARPKGGPKVTLAFISGRLDAWCGWGSGTLWNQHCREEWGHSDPEHSWRLLYELGAKRSWDDVMNYGQYDLSASPAYGMYDIVPIEADTEKLYRYDYLIFAGWNSMTEEIMDKLTAYVRQGGHLLMSAAHLNTSVSRDSAYSLVSNEKIRVLFGCSFTGETLSTSGGVKFQAKGADDRILYPGTLSHICDPIYSAGYCKYGKFALEGGEETAYISHSFLCDPPILPAVIENRLGSGTATLVTSLFYPGNNAAYPLYRGIVREFVTASARSCPIQILGSDRLRWSVYEGNKVYLLNTDYDMPITVRLLYKGRESSVTLASLELKSLTLEE